LDLGYNLFVMLQYLALILHQECRLDPSKTVLVALSGGPDSLCLFDAIWRLGYPIIAAHLNHRLRPEAWRDAQAVKQFVGERNLTLAMSEVDVGEFADTHGLSIEEAARLVRYRFLFEQAEHFNAQAVVVGHTADDQVETVLMHLLRGAGLSGLTGMTFRSFPTSWSQTIPLVRPLLGVWREEIHAYLSERSLQPVQDASNLDTQYFRNRIRQELIPALKTYNPQIRQRIWQTAYTLQGDNELLDRAVDAAWESCHAVAGPGYVSFKIGELQVQYRGMQRRLLRRAVSLLRTGLHDIDFDTIERGTKFLNKPKYSSQIDLSGGLYVFYEEDRLWVAAWEADLPTGIWPSVEQGKALDLQVPGSLNLSGGWQFYAQPAYDISQAFSQAMGNRDPYQAWLDFNDLQFPLIVRGRLPGDRFQPLGMRGHSTKLSDMLINLKLPSRARSTWPLLLSGMDIVWIPGFRLAHPYRLKEKTRSAVHLYLTREYKDDGEGISK
jgi:tRNA(Ile)-lysidine synthase